MQVGIAPAPAPAHISSLFQTPPLPRRQNFASTIVDSQLAVSSAPHPDPALPAFLERLDLLFVAAFALDLAVNAFAHWYRPFIASPWNIFDAVAVAVSVALAAVPGRSASLAASLQAVRVLRVIGRVPPLRAIAAALAVALLPVLGVLAILVLLISIGPPPHTPPPWERVWERERRVREEEGVGGEDGRGSGSPAAALRWHSPFFSGAPPR